MVLEERFELLMTGGGDELADPFPLYRELREAADVHDFGGPLVITSHAAILEVVRGDGEKFVNALGQRGDVAERRRAELTGPTLAAFDAIAAFSALIMPERNRDDHARLRSIVHRSFTPRRMAELESDIRRYIADLLAEMRRQDEPDLALVTNNLSLLVTSDLLGISHVDLARLQLVVGRYVATGSGAVAASPQALLGAHEALEELLDFGAELADHHRQGAVATDIVGCLLGAERDGQLTRQEFVAMLVFLVISAQETTTNLLSIGSIALLQQRDQWTALRADPIAVAPAATEELLRYVAPVQFVSRTALTEGTVAGTPFRSGQQLMLLLAAANRDPVVFTNPAHLDVKRRNAGEHLSLGHGIHFCLGASLLRLESRIFLSELARTFPEIELAAETFEWTGHVQLRRPVRVPVVLDR